MANLEQLTAILKAAQIMGKIKPRGSEFQEPPLPMPEPTPIPGVGQYGATGALPTNPGPPEPSYGGGSIPSDYWTRSDPNMGYLEPSLTVYPDNPADAGGYPAPSGPRSTSRTFGEQLLGNRLINPFARSRETWQQNASNGKPLEPGGSWPSAGGAAGASSQPWYSPGYIPPSGIRDAIARGDYDRAYGQTESSRESAKIMASQAYGGNPNNTRSFASEGRFLIGPEGDVRQYGDQSPGHRSMQFQMEQPSLARRSPEQMNAYLMGLPGYQKWMAAKRNRNFGANVAGQPIAGVG